MTYRYGLTLQPPWADAIFKLGKDIENRTWTTDYRGMLLIHSGKTFDKKSLKFPLVSSLVSSPSTLSYGVIIGEVRLVNVITGSASPWALPGCYHWVLDDPFLYAEPIPFKGRLGLWKFENV